MQLLDLAELERTSCLLLIDLEFTCWEDSIRMNWSDPTRPPEVIEVGIVAYDATGGVVLREFTNLVRPTLNSRLSDYCKALLGIAQEQVDAACLLGGVVWGIEGWLHSLGVEGAPTCSWGVNDRCFLTKNCRLVDCQDPFEGRDHIDLKTIIGRVFDSSAVDSQDRDRMRQELGIPENPRRHRALDDARDLIGFLRGCTTGPGRQPVLLIAGQ